jgi:hypothetical protein
MGRAFDAAVRILHDALRAGSLPFWCLCFLGGGVAGVCVDLDHIPYWVFGVHLPTPFNIFHFSPGRFLHPALFIIGCCVFACAGGLLAIMVLADVASEIRHRYEKAFRRPMKSNMPGQKE